jgi:hypothetical protein
MLMAKLSRELTIVPIADLDIYIFGSYLTDNTVRLYYKEQLFNAVWGNSLYLLWGS